MEKRAIFAGQSLPYLLLAPQLLITLVFFYWPASQAVWQSFLLQDAFGLRTEFIWLENYRDLFAQRDYYRAMGTTRFSLFRYHAVKVDCPLFAVQADKHIAGAGIQDALIWPHAVAPAIAGAVVVHVPALAGAGGTRPALAWHRLEPLLNGNHAMLLVVMPRPGSDQLQFPVLPGCCKPSRAR
jgi:sn-glycerol 3-phosphate transport system permease protein